MKYTPLITPAAATDIAVAAQYYEDQLVGLGVRFSSEVVISIDRICTLPLSFSVRYRNVRGIKINSFPYLLFYTVNKTARTIDILRVYNTYQKPFWR